jgi:hypothetical protein
MVVCQQEQRSEGSMNDEANSTGAGPVFPSSTDATPLNSGKFVYWLKRLLACNPFYLLSAALLLFGMYRVSIDPSFLSTEVSQLVFNFTSIQFYELLLVGTAIFLARRLIWYDSVLLLVLENLLILVPFILINQAGLIEQQTVWALCIFAVVVAVGRWGAARGWISVLKPSPHLLAAGAVVLVANAALVIAYRILQETKMGKGIASGAAYEMNEASWLWLLPTLCALAILLPCLREDGKLLVQRRWFPVILFLFWIAGTGAHLYALGYIYDFPLRRELLTPLLCVLAWVVHFRLGDFVEKPSPVWRHVTLTLPLVAALAAIGIEGSRVFFAVTALNALGFLAEIVLQRDNRLARHLFLFVLAMLVAAVPSEWVVRVGLSFNREKFIVVGAVAWLLLGALLSRDPRLALPAAFAVALAVGILRAPNGDAMHWAVQAGFVFFLLHSLCWRDYEHNGAVGVRIFMAAAWVAHSFVWADVNVSFWQPMIPAALVFTCWGLRGFVFQNWTGIALPIACLLVVLCNPTHHGVTKLQTTPTGVIAVGASFLLFAVGTTLALTKHRWQKR